MNIAAEPALSAAVQNEPFVITVSALSKAVARCLKFHPSADRITLHKDASVMVDLLGEMWFKNIESVMSTHVSEKIIECFVRWQGDHVPK